MVTKVEIACFEQFLLLSPCFQKVLCCRGVIKRGLYLEKLSVSKREFIGIYKCYSYSTFTHLFTLIKPFSTCRPINTAINIEQLLMMSNL